MSLHQRFGRIGLFLLVALLCGGMAASIRAAEAPQIVTLVTRDGVQIRITYFPAPRIAGTPDAKQVTPVILLHDHKESRATFAPLALKLQAFGEDQPKGPAFAVVSVDLRAHGESTKQEAANGEQYVLDAAKINRFDLNAMAGYDMEAVRSFLIERNDAGELNLNKLCIIGAGVGANVGVNWALQDWTAPPLAIGKQGQDVKALVLISPRWNYNGLSFQGPMKFRPLKQNAAWMLIYGSQDPKVKADIDRIEKQLERFHPKPAGNAAQRGGSLEITALPSRLQGSTLLKQNAAALDDAIINFLLQNVGAAQQPWTNRLGRIPQ